MVEVKASPTKEVFGRRRSRWARMGIHFPASSPGRHGCDRLGGGSPPQLRLARTTSASSITAMSPSARISPGAEGDWVRRHGFRFFVNLIFIPINIIVSSG